MPKIKRKQIVLLIVLIAVLFIITEILPAFVSKVVPTTTIEYGNLKVSDEVKCYALRDETVYFAKTAGNVEYKAKENDQLKVGSSVIAFTEKQTSKSEKETETKSEYEKMIESLGERAVVTNSNTAQRKGVFSTYVDGNENYFTLDNFDKITESKASDKGKETEDIKASSVKENQPMYKMVDQSRWYLVCWIDSNSISKYEEGNRVSVEFEDTSIKFNIEQIVEEGNKYKVLLSSNRYYENFAKFRVTDVKLVTTDLDGIIIDNECITTKDGNVGVYVVSKTGDNSFVRIKSLGSDGEKTVVAENSFYDKEGNLVNTVKVFDEVLKKK